MTLSRERFEELVADALESLPAFLRQKLENVAVLVEDQPSSEIQKQFPDQLLMGLYQGVPQPERSVWNLPTQPDVIHIYKHNIESLCATEKEIREQVRITVIHEIGHYFGLDEDALERLESGEP